jgi:cytochrome c
MSLRLRPALVATAIALGVFSGSALASADLAKAKNCMACHAADKKLVGPSYKQIAAKYGSDKGAVEKLTQKVRAGGSGVWGQVPMPPNPQVSADEAATLVQWVLSQK